MKARIESPLTLEEVAEHFDQWRRGKKKGERIPQRLWSEAVGLVDTYGVSQVTRVLRLSGRDLNARRGIMGDGRRRQGRGGKTAFVEIDPVVLDPARPQTGAAWLELQRPDGWRLRIQPSGGVEMLALLERFLRSG